MSLKQRIQKVALSVGLGLATLSGCASGNVNRRPSMREATRVLGTVPFMVTSLPSGYITDKRTEIRLRGLAGVYAGTADFRCTKNGYSVEGFYSQLANPEAIVRVLKDADTNDDKIVTRDEVRNLYRAISEKNCRKYAG